MTPAFRARQQAKGETGRQLAETRGKPAASLGDCRLNLDPPQRSLHYLEADKVDRRENTLR
jgi:hypothetical protein